MTLLFNLPQNLPYFDEYYWHKTVGLKINMRPERTQFAFTKYLKIE